MEITIKFNINDEVFYLSEGGIVAAHVKEVDVNVTMNQFQVDVLAVKYHLNNLTNVYEKNLFKTPELAAQSILEEYKGREKQ